MAKSTFAVCHETIRFLVTLNYKLKIWWLWWNGLVVSFYSSVLKCKILIFSPFFFFFFLFPVSQQNIWRLWFHQGPSWWSYNICKKSSSHVQPSIPYQQSSNHDQNRCRLPVHTDSSRSSRRRRWPIWCDVHWHRWVPILNLHYVFFQTLQRHKSDKISYSER